MSVLPLWFEIVSACVVALIPLYLKCRGIHRRSVEKGNRWVTHCHAEHSQMWVYVVNGRWNGRFPRRRCEECREWSAYEPGGCQKVRGPIDPTDEEALATARGEAEERCATLNAIKANYE